MGIIETAKEVVSLVQKADNIDLTNKILELQNQLLELVQNGWDKQKEIELLRRQMEELKNEKSVREELTFAHNAYWRGPAEEKGNGPYCANCWDQRTRLARMLHNGDHLSHCPSSRTVLELPWHASLRPQFHAIRAR